MLQLTSKNDDLSPSLRNKKMIIFRVISNLTLRQSYLEMLSP